MTWSAQAQRDLEDIQTYISLDAPRTAARFVDEMKASVATLSGFPPRGRRAGRASHLLIFGDYIARYAVRPGEVRVIRVIHGARRRAGV